MYLYVHTYVCTRVDVVHTFDKLCVADNHGNNNHSIDRVSPKGGELPPYSLFCDNIILLE